MMSEYWDLSKSEARWIFPERPDDTVNQYVDFLHRFDCDDTDGAELRISADTDFIVWLNGNLIGHGQYSDYPDRKTFECFSVSDALRTGSNSLAVTVFYNGRTSSVYRRGTPGVVFEITGTDAIAASGTETLCRTNPCYHSGPIAIVSHQLAYTFGYDARGEDGFQLNDYELGDEWTGIKSEEAALPEDRTQLLPRPIARLTMPGTTPSELQAAGVFRRDISLAEKQYESSVDKDSVDGLLLKDGTLVSPAWLMQRDLLSSRTTQELFKAPTLAELSERDGGISPQIKLSDADDGVYLIVDLGREEVGYIEFEIEAAAGVMIDLGYGEHVEDMRVRTQVGGRSFAGRYICRDGRQTFIHRYLRWSGCHLSMHIHSGEFTLHGLHLQRCEYPVENTGILDTGNPDHRRLLDVSRRTLHLCMHEHYEDTPWREQALYANDARTQALCGYYAFGDTAFPRSSFDLLGRGLRDDGFLMLCAPASPPVTIPSFTLVWMLAVRDHYLYSGDDSMALEFLPQMLTMLKAFNAERKDGLWPLRRAEGIWHFYDWSAGMSGYGDKDFDEGLVADAPLNCFLVLAMEAANEILKWSGQEADADLTTAVAEIRQGVRDRFWDEGQGVFLTHEKATVLTQLTQALAILAGVGSESEQERVLGRMNSEDSGLAEPGLSQSFYTYAARMTRKDLSGALVVAEIEEIWGRMLDAGATTFWETSRGASDFGNAGSLCHGWSAVPLYVWYHDLLGIRPLEPGFRTFAVDPIPGILETCAGIVPVPDGEIRFGWDREGDEIRFEIEAPEGCESKILTTDQHE